MQEKNEDCVGKRRSEQKTNVQQRASTTLGLDD
jgi:hypothetical protein